MAITVIGVFNNAEDAQKAVDQLIDEGYLKTNIDLSTQTGTFPADSVPTNYQKNTTDQPLNMGGINTFFDSLFDDKDDADRHAWAADRSSVVTVHAMLADEAERAADILDENGAVDVNDLTAAPPVHDSLTKAPSESMGAAFLDEKDITNDAVIANTTAVPPMDAATGEQTIQVIEENLEVGKRSVDRGGVRVRSRIVERPVEEQIRLREERVTLQRTAVNRPATAADLSAFQEGEITLTERAEVPVVKKTASVVEEISINKEVSEHEAVIRDTVRKTDVDVEQLGSTTQAGLEGDDITYATT